MRTTMLLHAWLAILGVLAGFPARAQQPGEVKVVQWNLPTAASEQGTGGYITRIRESEACGTLRRLDAYAMGTHGPIPWPDSTADESVAQVSNLPPGNKAGQAGVGPGACRGSGARAAVADALAALIRTRGELDKLREAVDEAVPIQIGRCQCVGVDGCEYVEENWQSLENDARTNAGNIISLTPLVVVRIRAEAKALERYVREFGGEEGRALGQAIAQLGKAAGAYDQALLANAEAANAIANQHNCGGAVEEFTNAAAYFKDGDEAWTKALQILKDLGQAQPGKERCLARWKCHVRCGLVDEKTGLLARSVEGDGFGSNEKAAFEDAQFQLEKSLGAGFRLKQCRLVGRCKKE